jgi:enoyl-CoA hydratase/carnithine racemase
VLDNFYERTSDPADFRPGSFAAVAGALKLADRDSTIACSLSPCRAVFPYRKGRMYFSDCSAAAQGLFRALVNVKKPTIAAAGGEAIGLGMAMLLHVDAVYHARKCVESAVYRLGIVTGSGIEPLASCLLPLASGSLDELGYRKAFEIFCLGGELTAAEAERRRLITRAVERTELSAVAFASAARLAGLPARSLGATRELLQPQRAKILAGRRLRRRSSKSCSARLPRGRVSRPWPVPAGWRRPPRPPGMSWLRGGNGASGI